jgi:hypothetical protein
MESTYNIVVAMWVTTWLIAQYRIFYRTIDILGRMEPANITLRWWPAAWLIFGIGSFITVPLIIFPVLSDKYRDIFVRGYVRSLLEIKE